jgi:hypothetical protein
VTSTGARDQHQPRGEPFHTRARPAAPGHLRPTTHQRTVRWRKPFHRPRFPWSCSWARQGRGSCNDASSVVALLTRRHPASGPRAPFAHSLRSSRSSRRIRTGRGRPPVVPAFGRFPAFPSRFHNRCVRRGISTSVPIVSPTPLVGPLRGDDSGDKHRLRGSLSRGPERSVGRSPLTVREPVLGGRRVTHVDDSAARFALSLRR